MARTPSTSGTGTDRGSRLPIVGFLLMPVLCCGLPLLASSGILAGGVLAAAGGALSNPWLIAAAVVVLAAGATVWSRRHANGRASCDLSATGTESRPATDASCCPPPAGVESSPVTAGRPAEDLLRTH